MLVKIFELRFVDPQASNLYVAAKNSDEVVADLKGSFGDDLATRLRELTAQEIQDFGFPEHRVASAAITGGIARTYILANPFRNRKK